MQPLYFSPIQPSFEKSAAEVALPENANLWPNEIMQELYKQVPYIADFEANVVMDRVDAERGYGFGHVEVHNKTELQQGASEQAFQAVGVQQARIPVIIKDRKLLPFDVIITSDSKAMPLTEGRMRQALFRPQAFDVTSRTPGDQSMVGQLYPPYRQNFGMGGGGVAASVGMGKEGSALEDFLAKEAFFGLGDKSDEPRAASFKPTEKHFASLGMNESDSKDMVKKWPAMERTMTDSDINSFHKEWRDRGLSHGLPSSKKKTSAQKCSKCGSMEKCSCWGMGKKSAANVPNSTMPESSGPKVKDVVPKVKQSGFAGRLGNEAGVGFGEAVQKIAPEVGKDLGSGLVGQLSETAAKHKGKLLAAGAALYAGNKALDYGIKRHQDKKLAKDIVDQVKQGSILSAILPTIDADDYAKFASAFEDLSVQALFRKNAAAVGASLKTLSAYDPVSIQKTAAALEASVRPDVVQVTKLAQGYRVKKASSVYWAPTSQDLDRGGAIRAVGEKLVLAADLTGSVTAAEGAGVAEEAGPESKPELVASFGLYRVKDEAGQELVGYVFPNLLDVDGTALPVALFTNGSVTAMQEAIAGESVGKDSGLVFGPMKGHGMFVRQLPNGSVDAMVPMTIKGGYSEGGENKMHVETFDGREVFVAVQPNLQRPTEVDGTCLVPESFRWLPLGGQETSLVEHPQDWGQAKQASRAFASVTLRTDGNGIFSISGMPVEKIASAERSFISTDDALFLLAGLGTDLGYAKEKIGQALAFSAPVQVRIGRYVKTASERKAESVKLAADFLSSLPDLRRSLVKEAAFVPDPLAVDTVLSLGFINPENIMTFVSYLPQMDGAQERLCELLVAARLGIADVPTSSLEKAIKSLEEVLEGLKVLAFNRA